MMIITKKKGALMKSYFCNPINFEYRYQFIRNKDLVTLNREAADPSMILYKDKYYIFPSMTKGYLVSEDMVNWEMKKLSGLPIYDYAPDVCVTGDYIYFSASRRNEPCNFYRTNDLEKGEFECIMGTFDFWDPNLFLDDDGRFYFYWGCSSIEPLYGIELDPLTMLPIGNKIALIDNHIDRYGYERIGNDHNGEKSQDLAFEKMLINGLAPSLGKNPEEILDIRDLLPLLPSDQRIMMERLLSNAPNIEGAWMTKYNNKYYLQYSGAGTEYNIYSDGVYISDKPLGPFELARNNPYSYSPGGFMPGAGHGSTLKDKYGNWWHTATMRISLNHNFERRIGIWPAGFDSDGELFCNQRYGDWPMAIENKMDPWRRPDWMLLSYGKSVTVSSNNLSAPNVVDENVQTFWQAEVNDLKNEIIIDLGEDMEVRCVQVNFADVPNVVEFPEEELENDPDFQLIAKDRLRQRFIDDDIMPIRYTLEASADNIVWTRITDKSNVNTSLPHDSVFYEKEVNARFIKLKILAMPYNKLAAVSGLRIFGNSSVISPIIAEEVQAIRLSGMDMKVTWHGNGMGYEVLWGHEKNKLYHSYRVFGKNEVEIRGLIADEATYYVRIDSFNEGGITEGKIIKVRSK